MNEHAGKICPICSQEILEENFAIVCEKCGVAYHQECWEKSGGCPHCGNRINSEKEIPADPVPVQPPISSISPAHVYYSAAPAVAKSGKKKKLIIGISIGVIIIVLAAFLVMHFVQEGQKTALREQFMGEWKRADGSIILVLDIDEDTITYRTESMYAYLNTTIAIMDYKPISGDTIKIDGLSEYKIEFIESDKTSAKGMVTTPSFIDTDREKIWVRS